MSLVAKATAYVFFLRKLIQNNNFKDKKLSFFTRQPRPVSGKKLPTRLKIYQQKLTVL